VRVFRISLAIVGVLLLALAVIIMQTRSAAADTSLTAGTLLVAGSGHVYAYDRSGRQLGVLDDKGNARGACQDQAGNLYVTNFSSGTMSKFDSSGTLTNPKWGGPFSSAPEGCVTDASGAIYVGEVGGDNRLRKFDSSGHQVAVFKPAVDQRGVDWIDLSSDQCTIFYTSEGSSVKRFNVCTQTQLSDFANRLDTQCFALRIRLNGDLMVACDSAAYRLSNTGARLQTYALPETGLFAMNLDPDGTSFWTAAFEGSSLYRVDIASGKVLGSIHSDVSAVGLAFIGEPLAAGGGAGQSVYAASVPDVRHADFSMPVVITGVLVAAVGMLLIPFPSQLFEDTFEQNRAEIGGWFAFLRPLRSAASTLRARLAGLDTRRSRSLAFVVFLALTGLLGAELDPGFGADARTLAMVLGTAAATAAVVFAWGSPINAYVRRRTGERGHLKVIIGALPVAVFCVLVSRLVKFSPGYLYGLIAGFYFSRELTKGEAGRTTALAAAVGLVVCTISWLALAPVHFLVEHASGAGSPGIFLAGLLEDFVVGVVVAGLGSVVFGLVPLRFLPGKTLITWNRLAWSALYGIGLFEFVQILNNPATHMKADPLPPASTSIGLFLGFGLASVAFWAYFRFRRVPGPTAAEPEPVETTPIETPALRR
jgi:hypothetical protein